MRSRLLPPPFPLRALSLVSSLRLSRSEYRRMACSVRSVPAPLRAPPRGAPLAQSTNRAHLPPPFLLHRPSLVSTRSGNYHIDHVAHAARFPCKTTHRCHHAQLPTITRTLFQPSPTSPTAAHLKHSTAKLLNRGCSKLHQVCSSHSASTAPD
ncbi:hypothetical protein GUJ93_ZPchr0011g27133 [Zizania palustris]|uniref:Uncharacterized protein n=1 Tax=Zizania palustris TaxID=103762 RepID=A0A8J6BP81_ZIZPA|nr:hypothetical protein GUJ93_ZPchr0011g27133 [Zizania palustris]